MAVKADVLGWIDTCQNAYEKFQTAYEICSRVVTNFREQRYALMEEANFLMNERVNNIKETVSTQPEDNLRDMAAMKELLQESRPTKVTAGGEDMAAMKELLQESRPTKVTAGGEVMDVKSPAQLTEEEREFNQMEEYIYHFEMEAAMEIQRDLEEAEKQKMLQLKMRQEQEAKEIPEHKQQSSTENH